MASESNVAVWATATSTHSGNGRVIIFRFARDLKPHFDRASQPDRIIIVWRYKSETGLPLSDEHQRMDIFEDTLGPALFEEEFATLALVSTGENLREWIYYARSEDEFMVRLNKALDGEAFPIEIHTAADPAWETYENFTKGLKVPATESTRLREFAERYTAAWCSQDAQSVAAFYSPDGSLTINGGAAAVGRDAITAAAQSFMTAFPDLHVAMDELSLVSGRTIYRWKLTGTNSGPGGTGRTVHISGFEEWQITDDGLIATSKGSFNEHDYRRQLNP